MQRRTLLKLGIGSAIVLAAAGGAVALLQPGLVNGKLSAPARLVLRRVAQAMLAGTLPVDEDPIIQSRLASAVFDAPTLSPTPLRPIARQLLPRLSPLGAKPVSRFLERVGMYRPAE